MLIKVVLLTNLFTIGLTLTEPCETNVFIDDYKRSIAYVPTEEFICDSNLKEGWYRITSGAGELMPTECVKFGWRCGTSNPIYLKDVPGVFPEQGIEVNRIAYAVKDADCFAQELNIKIKNCTEYLVYYLTAPTGCDYGYCFGSELPCAEGESSSTGFTPGCSIVFPDVTLSPRINVHNQERDGTHNGFDWTFIIPEFTCEADDATSEYAYDIRFYINDVEMIDANYVNVSHDDIHTATLQQQHWENTFRLNMLVKCSMQARYIGRGAPGKRHFSNAFFAGIKVREDFKNGVWIKEGETKTIYLTVTYPVGCSYMKGESQRSSGCYVSLYNGIPIYQKDECKHGINEDNIEFTLEEKECKRRIFHRNWEEDQPIIVTGKANDLADREVRVVALRLYTPTNSFADAKELYVWKDITLPDINLYIEDADLKRYGSKCYSSNDPHMRIFDNVRWELQGRINKGEYIMYKHATSPQQVNAYYTPCYPANDALCNCGIAIRSGTSIFIANFCPTGEQVNRKYNRYVISRECDDQHMLVQEIGTTGYTITLPTGTIVEFNHGIVNYPGDDPFYGIHGIYITPSTHDYGLTSGLCGIYNDFKDDEFLSNDDSKIVTTHEEFAKQWKVTNANESFFRRDGVLPALQYNIQEYCTCKQESDTKNPPEYHCESTDKLARCGTYSTTTVYHASCISSAHTIHKREVNDKNINNDDDGPPMYDMINYDEDDNITVENSGEWTNGLTEEIAREKCEVHIKTLPAFSVCAAYVPILDTESFITDCISDMKVTGSDDFLIITIQNFERQCVSTAIKMENLTETNTTNSNGDSKNIVEVISESTCFNNCSGSGSCITGICYCFEGYHGGDCSKDSDTAPRVMKMAFEQSCDNSVKKCEKIAVPGIDFATANLTCKLRKITVSTNNSVKVEDEGSIIAGIYSSSFLMYCPVPNSRRRRSVNDDTIATGYFISVSNNGHTFSDELSLVIYDGGCFECNSSSLNCEKLDTCPDESVTENPASSNLGTIIGIISGIGFLALFIILCYCVKKKICIKRKPNISDSSVILQYPDAKGWHSEKPVLQSSDIIFRQKSNISTLNP